MPYLPWNRPEAGLTEDRSYEALLSGAPLPDDAPSDSRLLADLVGALTAPTAAEELAGFSRVRAAYTAQFAPRRHGTALRWRLSVLDNPKLSPKLAAPLIAGVLGLGGLGAAAYAGALPDPAQNAAHRIIGAPAAHPSKADGHRQAETGASSSTPAGPDATGAAAFGLCTAYEHAQPSDQAAAFASLATAAGAAGIDAYCAAITPPGSAAATHPVGKPSAVPSHPTGKPSWVPAHPTGQPSTVPAGPPSSLPAHPTGQPSTLPAHPTGQPSTVPAGPPSSLPAHPTGKPSTVPAGPPTSRPTGR